ncbi:MAG: SHOCT domain-containing protein [Armatimonadetes bacterium]|nr:SHOCT domain-containing protein [Armatimonadota bacterium]
MDFIFGLFIFIMAIIVILGIAKIIVTSQNKKKMEENLSNLDAFKATQKIMGDDGLSGLAIDEFRKEICIIKKNSGNFTLDTIPYHDLLSSEIFEDGKTITRTSRTSQLGGALFGGLALGGVGAIIGGLSGRKTSTNQVTKIDLRLTINRTNAPVHDINLMNFEGTGSELLYLGAIQKARHWQGLLEVIIRRTDEEDKLKESKAFQKVINSVDNNSVADELKKLADLKKQGIITEEEFDSQKEKILS